MKKLALALALGLLGLPAMAQDKPVDLKISIWLPPAHPLVPSTKEWAADIEKSQGHKVHYPMIGDSDLSVAKLYGMLPGEAGDETKLDWVLSDAERNRNTRRRSFGRIHFATHRCRTRTRMRRFRHAMFVQ